MGKKRDGRTNMGPSGRKLENVTDSRTDAWTHSIKMGTHGNLFSLVEHIYITRNKKQLI